MSEVNAQQALFDAIEALLESGDDKAFDGCVVCVSIDSFVELQEVYYMVSDKRVGQQFDTEEPED